mmetsp:Transcript_99176/g.259146  ORF Transcript_99176/g.259146 Transcript_99176/m.259146 type:complete len:238 (+) Transcript_99176:354-1067(+)
MRPQLFDRENPLRIKDDQLLPIARVEQDRIVAPAFQNTLGQRGKAGRGHVSRFADVYLDLEHAAKVRVNADGFSVGRRLVRREVDGSSTPSLVSRLEAFLQNEVADLLAGLVEACHHLLLPLQGLCHGFRVLKVFRPRARPPSFQCLLRFAHLRKSIIEVATGCVTGIVGIRTEHIGSELAKRECAIWIKGIAYLISLESVVHFVTTFGANCEHQQCRSREKSTADRSHRFAQVRTM